MSIDLSVSDEGVALITINRPERLNAMDAEHYQALSKAWMTVVRDSESSRASVSAGDSPSRFLREPAWVFSGSMLTTG